MESFWQIVREWPGFGQGLFFLLVIGVIYGAVVHGMYYLNVVLHGWPPPNTPLPSMSDEDEE